MLNTLLLIDSGGQGDMQIIFKSVKGKCSFTQLDLASGSFYIKKNEKDRHKAAFRDCDGVVYKSISSGFELTVSPAALTRALERALVPPSPGVVSWLGGILILSYT